MTTALTPTTISNTPATEGTADGDVSPGDPPKTGRWSTIGPGSLIAMISEPSALVQTVTRPELTQEGVGLGVGSSALEGEATKPQRVIVATALIAYRIGGRILARYLFGPLHPEDER
jgi:hypothetical protein